MEKEEEGEQTTIMVDFHIRNLKIIILLILKQGKKKYDNNHLTFYKPKPMNKSKVKCFRCHRYWHYKSKCHANLNRNDGKSNFTLKKEKMSLLMACI